MGTAAPLRDVEVLWRPSLDPQTVAFGDRHASNVANQPASVLVAGQWPPGTFNVNLSERGSTKCQKDEQRHKAVSRQPGDSSGVHGAHLQPRFSGFRSFLAAK